MSSVAPRSADDTTLFRKGMMKTRWTLKVYQGEWVTMWQMRSERAETGIESPGVVVQGPMEMAAQGTAVVQRVSSMLGITRKVTENRTARFI